MPNNQNCEAGAPSRGSGRPNCSYLIFFPPANSSPRFRGRRSSPITLGLRRFLPLSWPSPGLLSMRFVVGPSQESGPLPARRGQVEERGGEKVGLPRRFAFPSRNSACVGLAPPNVRCEGTFSCRSLRDSRALLPLIRACVPVQPEQGAAQAISACPSSCPGPGSAQCCLTEEGGRAVGLPRAAGPRLP